MPPKKNPLKLNNLQLRTLALLQVIASDENNIEVDELSGDVTILRLPHAHGDHFHVGSFVLSSRDGSGLSNPAVWVALERKGLARQEGLVTKISESGLSYDTGLADKFLSPSDH